MTVLTDIESANQEGNGRKAPDLSFRPSLGASLGVEIELQILDRETGDLTPGAPRLLKACAEDSIGNVTAELMQSMIEVKTDICGNVQDVRDQLFCTVGRLRNIATSLGYELALGGTHPFHRPTTGAVFPDERYDRIMDRLAWLTYQRVVFGLHVHVGVASGDQAIAVVNRMVQYLPHLLALSASSPFWQGVDSGLASCRAALYRLLPHAGVPRYFGSWKEFRRFCQVMHDCGSIATPKDIYWDIRPRPEFGTIEFRICDMPITLTMTLAIVALTRTLVLATERLLAERPLARRGDMRRHWVAVENKWLATRHGLRAMYIRTPSGKRRPLAHDLAELISRVLPTARETGDHSFLTPLLPVDKIETGAQLLRRRYRETGSWRSVIEDMTRSLSDELAAPRSAA